MTVITMEFVQPLGGRGTPAGVMLVGKVMNVRNASRLKDVSWKTLSLGRGAIRVRLLSPAHVNARSSGLGLIVTSPNAYHLRTALNLNVFTGSVSKGARLEM